MGQSPPADLASGSFGGAPCGATNRVRGVPTWVAVPACGPRQLGLQWSSLWATSRVRGVPKWVAVPACGSCCWCVRWGSMWGHEPCE
eukprot:952430-Pyramimonas_sp.AAC.1